MKGLLAILPGVNKIHLNNSCCNVRSNTGLLQNWSTTFMSSEHLIIVCTLKICTKYYKHFS